MVAATLLIVGRYLQRRDDRALLEGAMLCALAFFVLATRMHERYVYGAFLLAMPLVAFGRGGLWSSIVLTVTMYLNLAYSLAYQTVMEQQIDRRERVGSLACDLASGRVRERRAVLLDGLSLSRRRR